MRGWRATLAWAGMGAAFVADAVFAFVADAVFAVVADTMRPGVDPWLDVAVAAAFVTWHRRP